MKKKQNNNIKGLLFGEETKRIETTQDVHAYSNCIFLFYENLAYSVS